MELVWIILSLLGLVIVGIVTLIVLTFKGGKKVVKGVKTRRTSRKKDESFE